MCKIILSNLGQRMTLPSELVDQSLVMVEMVVTEEILRLQHSLPLAVAAAVLIRAVNAQRVKLAAYCL